MTWFGVIRRLILFQAIRFGKGNFVMKSMDLEGSVCCALSFSYLQTYMYHQAAGELTCLLYVLPLKSLSAASVVGQHD